MGEATPETIAQELQPTLDRFVKLAEPHVRKISEEVYDRLLFSVQDYLIENAQWNIGEDVRRCRKIELDNLKLREVNADLVKYLSIFLGHDDRFQISVGGNPNAVDAMLDEAHAALAKAQGQ